MKMIDRPLSITIVVLLYLIALLFSNLLTVKCQPNTTIDDYDCSEDTYDPDSGYGQEVNYGLDELTYGTDSQPQYQYTLTGTYAVGFAYCQLRLSPNDCVVCLEAANDFLRDDCEYSVAAYVAMIDCGMRYGPINNGPSAPNGPSAA